MNFMGCIRNFTLDQCYGDYLKTHHSMMEPMRRMSDMKARIHNFGRLMCGMDGNDYNVTGLPKNITDLLKCKKEFYDRASPTSLIPLIHSVPVKGIRPLMQEQENCTRVWPSYLWALLAIFCRKPLTADAHEFSSLLYDTVSRIIEDNLNKRIFRNL